VRQRAPASATAREHRRMSACMNMNSTRETSL
jgi:hypothetical protein